MSRRQRPQSSDNVGPRGPDNSAGATTTTTSSSSGNSKPPVTKATMPVMLCRNGTAMPWGFTMADASVAASSGSGSKNNKPQVNQFPRARIIEVDKGSLADQAGLRATDVICGIDGQKVPLIKSFSSLRGIIVNGLTLRLMIERQVAEGEAGSVRRLRLPLPPSSTTESPGSGTVSPAVRSPGDGVLAPPRLEASLGLTPTTATPQAAAAATAASASSSASESAQTSTARKKGYQVPPMSPESKQQQQHGEATPQHQQQQQQRHKPVDSQRSSSSATKKLQLPPAPPSATSGSAQKQPQQQQQQQLGWLGTLIGPSCEAPSANALYQSLQLPQPPSSSSPSAAAAAASATASEPLRMRQTNEIESERLVLQRLMAEEQQQQHS